MHNNICNEQLCARYDCLLSNWCVQLHHAPSAEHFCGHFRVQAHGCIELLVAAMASTDAVCAQFAVWAVQSLTGVLTSPVENALSVTASTLTHADLSGNRIAHSGRSISSPISVILCFELAVGTFPVWMPLDWGVLSVRAPRWAAKLEFITVGLVCIQLEAAKPRRHYAMLEQSWACWT